MSAGLEYKIIIDIAAAMLGDQLRDMVKAARQQHNRDAEEKFLAIREQNAEIIRREGLITKVLSRYYPQERWDAAELFPYSFELHGRRIDSAIATTPGWLGLAIPLEGDSEQCEPIRVSLPEVEVPKDRVAKFIASAERRNLQIWDTPIFRLVDLNVEHRRLCAHFALDQFLRYKFTTGLLADELIDALIEARLDLNVLFADVEKLLPLRSQLMPNARSVRDFPNRMCAGGFSALFAIARGEPDNDFLIVLQKRAEQVADDQNMLAVVPKGFHQPCILKPDPSMIEPERIRLSYSVWREIFEEMFGGAELTVDDEHLEWDWFFDNSEPLRWLRDRKALTIECLSFGINLVLGNYEFGVLVAIPDEDFYRQYRSFMRRCWETAHFERVSSLDERRLTEVILRPGWTGESLVALVQGLKRLKELYPKRVKLPNIRNVLP